MSGRSAWLRSMCRATGPGRLIRMTRYRPITLSSREFYNELGRHHLQNSLAVCSLKTAISGGRQSNVCAMRGYETTAHRAWESDGSRPVSMIPKMRPSTTRQSVDVTKARRPTCILFSRTHVARIRRQRSSASCSEGYGSDASVMRMSQILA